jgi:hypothetical protein
MNHRMNHRMSVRIVRVRDGVDQSVDSAGNPITSAANRSLGGVSECTPLSGDTADRHDTNIHIPGTHP